MKKYLFSYLAFVLMLSCSVFASTSLDCDFKTTCDSDEAAFLYANGNFVGLNGAVLSSNVAVNFDSINYNKTLCCKSQYGQLGVTFISVNSECVEGDELMYFTNDSNARVRFPEFEILNDRPFGLLNESNYLYKSCVEKPEEFGLFDIIASDRDYSTIGYTCMYKINDLENGMVSGCDASFGLGNKYKYTVWGRLWEDVSSLKCNADCTSKLDGRVYSACATQVQACKYVPTTCDGALLNSWIPEVDGTGNLTGSEVYCASPWDVTRSKIFTNEPIDIQSEESKCENIVGKSFPVVLDNKQVNLRVYVCED